MESQEDSKSSSDTKNDVQHAAATDDAQDLQPKIVTQIYGNMFCPRRLAKTVETYFSLHSTTDLFTWNLRHTTAVWTAKRKARANLKMALQRKAIIMTAAIGITH